jgi:probable phosphoglycerate mutase
MTRRLVVEADGGSRGNPGPAGYGAVVRDPDSREALAEVAEAIGRATNNVAEYRGAIAGLRAALDLDPEAAVEVRMDSKLVVEQLSGRWQVRHPQLRPLAREASALAGRFRGGVRFTWVPRERNVHADRLANAAMDAAAAGRPWSRHEVRAEVPEPEPEPDSRPASTAGPPDRTPGWAAPAAPPTTTVLLRHGETTLSVERRFSGVGDVPLTAYGEAQARAAATRLVRRGGIDAVVSSPLARARHTAAIVAQALRLPQPRVDDDLRETDFGDWEGHTFAEVQQKWPDDVAAWLASEQVAPPGGESFAATTARVRGALARLVRRCPRQTVLVVAHVTPIKTLVRLAVAAPPVALFRMHLDACSVCEVDWYADGPAVLRLFNDAAHVTALAAPAGR